VGLILRFAADHADGVTHLALPALRRERRYYACVLDATGGIFAEEAIVRAREVLTAFLRIARVQLLFGGPGIPLH
jgi:hypothetical protein